MECKCSMCYGKKFDIHKDIIEAIKNGDLVIFAGSGVSTEGRGIFPNSLYSEIKEELNLEEDISFSYLMQKYCDTPNGRKKLIKKIRNRFDYYNEFTEVKRMMESFFIDLSSIYTIKDIITTNWDDLFERECSCRPIIYSEDIALLEETERKVYKIHGSIENVSTMVITQEDYENCYENLERNLLGSKIKEILTRKTILFIGYSFEDEDFKKIWEFLKKQLGSLQPHFFIVSPDPVMNEKMKEENVTVIDTIAKEFMESLKEHLEKEKFILKREIIDTSIKMLRDRIIQIHRKTCRYLNICKRGMLAYSVFYQDGYIHSLDRAKGMKRTGLYYCHDYIIDGILTYEEMSKNFYKKGRFFDAAYTMGYSDGLNSLLSFYSMFVTDGKIEPEMNAFYVFNNNSIHSLRELREEILNCKTKKIINYVNEYFKKSGFKDSKTVDIHHSPFL